MDSMRRFDRTDEATDENMMGSERLRAFNKAMWAALVPPEGECASVQGELIRASERLQGEYFRNGLGNYYEPAATLGETFYGGMLVFLLDTLIANRSTALDAEDVAYFEEVRRLVEPDWLRHHRMSDLEEKCGESDASEAETRELEELEVVEGLGWEHLFRRAERC